MRDAQVHRLARKLGIAADWVDHAGADQRVSIGSLRAILRALGFPCDTPGELADSSDKAFRLSPSAELPRFLTATVGQPVELRGVAPDAGHAELQREDGTVERVAILAGRKARLAGVNEPGYHRLRIGDRETTLAVCPPRCTTVADLAPGARLWGLAVQLYGLRRAGDGGAGDAGALVDLAEAAARQGADAVALSPTHSLFTADLQRFGPYSPSSRLFLNPVYADPKAVFSENEIAVALASLRDGYLSREAAPLIDWPPAARDKLTLLRRLFDGPFRARLRDSPNDPPACDFESFRTQGGQALEGHVRFEALHARHLAMSPPRWSWRDWPPEWRDPASGAVAAFAASHTDEIAFQIFLQWITDRSFAQAQASARAAGMRIGCISDLAVGMDSGGSQAWSQQDDLLLGLSVGAPPDLFNANGQDWGLTAISPHALPLRGFTPFLATVRAAMRNAGGIRIDHAMGLERLWLVPAGASARDGAYIAYPRDDLLRLIGLESRRHRAIVIAEDLGTVPAGFRKRLADAGILGMDVLWFTRDDEGFCAPAAWRSDAVAMTTTHDLPTVAGWWRGADIETRRAIGRMDAADAAAQSAARAKDRAALWAAFETAGVASGTMPSPQDTDGAVDAAVRFIARTPSPLALLPLEDALGIVEQPNLPGTIDEHPNWRRRLADTAANVFERPAVKSRLAALAKERS